MWTYGDRDQETICAVASAPGHGGISVIRVSGSRALEIVRKSHSKLPENPQSHQAYFGSFIDPKNSEMIDEALCLYFAKGKSYTGDETVEISCHGNPTICQKILKILVENGAQSALPGEFSYRAFANGNIDLVQAEGVLSLIQSESESSLRQSLRQLKGDLSNTIEGFESEVIWALAHIVADIDFSTEGLTVANIPEILERLGTVKEKLGDLIQSYGQGRKLKEGTQVLILGVPNAGKSSLLNALAQEKRVIVSPIAGTTRDLVDIQVLWGGKKWNFTDSAGLRASADEIEQIGIQKTQEAIKDTDLAIFVVDSTQDMRTQLSLPEIRSVKPEQLTIFVNKLDLLKKTDSEVAGEVARSLVECNIFPDLSSAQLFLKDRGIFGSALDIKAREFLMKKLSDLEQKSGVGTDRSILMVARHHECLERAQKNLERGMEILSKEKSEELAAFELQECLRSLQEVLGKVFDDQILDRVFKEFCIGK